MENYMSKTADVLCEMRLIVEGAASLMENEVMMSKQNETASMETLFVAIHHLRSQIQQLQTDHRNELLRQDEEAINRVKTNICLRLRFFETENRAKRG